MKLIYAYFQPIYKSVPSWDCGYVSNELEREAGWFLIARVHNIPQRLLSYLQSCYNALKIVDVDTNVRPFIAKADLPIPSKKPLLSKRKGVSGLWTTSSDGGSTTEWWSSST